MTTYTLDQIVAGYVKIRDEVAAIKKRHAEELAPWTRKLEVLEGHMLNHLETAGVESARTKGGTVYKNKQTSVTVDDGHEFRRHVTEFGAWNLVDFRANKPGVTAYVAMNGEPPPGVKYSEFMGVGVRRPPAATEE